MSDPVPPDLTPSPRTRQRCETTSGDLTVSGPVGCPSNPRFPSGESGVCTFSHARAVLRERKG